MTFAPQDPARKVSVVIPTYNNLSLLLECIDSVRTQDYPRENVEIIVVDNASDDRTSQVITDRFPYVKLIRMESNTGFAVACNRGATVAQGDYVAFLNNDAIADSNWLATLFTALDAADERTVCVASRIISRDGDQVEYDGAASNLFGAGRPTSVWGWLDLPGPPGTGRPVLFASGGAMLIHRATFLEVGGFDASFFAYFEDVDLGWRLWILGYRVIYAPDAVVRHIGGATGKRSGMHRRYTLWESNALATIIKNYEDGNMEKILTAALLLEYKRALLSSVDAINFPDYHLGGPKDTNVSNVERVPKISVAHIAAIDRLNSILPDIMNARRDIQAKRVRSDADILRLLGKPYEPQFAGAPYAEAARALVAALQLYDITAHAAPNRVLIIGSHDDLSQMQEIANDLKSDFPVALSIIEPGGNTTANEVEGYTLHRVAPGDDHLTSLVTHADVIVAMPSSTHLEVLRDTNTPIALFGTEEAAFHPALTFQTVSDSRLAQLCREPGTTPARV